jgi:hypothetical protein
MNSKGSSAAPRCAVLDEAAAVVGGEVGGRVLGAGFAHDAFVGRQLAVGAGADAEVVAEGPVVEVVPAFAVGLGEGGGFVVAVAGVARRASMRSCMSAEASGSGTSGGLAAKAVLGSRVRW